MQLPPAHRRAQELPQTPSATGQIASCQRGSTPQTRGGASGSRPLPVTQSDRLYLLSDFVSVGIINTARPAAGTAYVLEARCPSHRCRRCRRCCSHHTGTKWHSCTPWVCPSTQYVCIMQSPSPRSRAGGIERSRAGPPGAARTRACNRACACAACLPRSISFIPWVRIPVRWLLADAGRHDRRRDAGALAGGFSPSPLR